MKIKKQVGTILSNEKGFVLPLGLMFLAIISILGTSAVTVTTTDLKIGSNYKRNVQAFYDAEAGSQYAIAMIEDGLANDTLALSGSSLTVNYIPPTGFSFDTITALTQVGATSNYSFQVTGHSGNANNTIEVAIARDPTFEYGAFGDKKLDMKSNGSVYSYDSSVITNPVPADSTGEGDVGSNGEVIVYNDTFIDGNVGLGNDDAGTEAVYTATGVPIVNGENADVPRVDPDPLGINSGGVYDPSTYSASNDNAGADPPIVGNAISLGNGDILTLTAGNYYLTSIELKAGSTLSIDASGGAVNIYLTGALEAKNGSSINLTGDPPDFTIFSNSEDNIDFKHGSAFRGTLYAPYSSVVVKTVQMFTA